MSKEQTTPAPGQVWKDNDPRIERYVVITSYDRERGRLTTMTCTVKGGTAVRSRRNEQDIIRFITRLDGKPKRNGFTFTGVVV